ncbi:helix-turn-helix domain-containing protein [Streptomyces sp. NPDC047315]|uniref:helix-turn-helix domain-containing protein n=1 Tax=Streptomyces sp. NPDC047315 TaxID=3155142 RepID=UPI0034005DFD
MPQRPAPLDHAARVLAETDPVRRFHAAEAAAEAAAAPYKQAAAQAIEDLIAQHDGNVAAAARELGFERQTLYARRKRSTAQGGDSARPRVAQAQPALNFDSPEAARNALLDWELRQRDVTDQLDVLLLGALAAGVEPVDISADSGVGLDTLRRIRPGGNITISKLDQFGEEVEDFARAIAARSFALNATATTSTERAAARIWGLAREHIVTNVAPLALVPALGIRREDFANEEDYVDAVFNREPTEEEKAAEQREPTELAAIAGADAWLAATYLLYRRFADGPPRTGQDPDEAAVGVAVRGAYGELADAILHLRTTGQVPPTLTAAAS